VTDWKRVILEVKAAGMSVKALAYHAACAPNTLYNILRGSREEPLHSEGVAILEIHGRLCGHTAKVD
jgi:lambda repressor-like predicted transcriptional regulator